MAYGYYKAEKAVGLGPIILALSVVAVLGFGALYALFSHKIQSAGSDDLNGPMQQLQQQQEQLDRQIEENTPKASKKHNHA